MPIEDVRVIKCDGTDCDKATTFNPQDPQQVAALPEWIKSVRMVNRGDKKNYAYCSDVCEVKGVTAGNLSLKGNLGCIGQHKPYFFFQGIGK